MFREQARKRLTKKAKKGFRGFPVATVAFYGPDDRRASKLAVGIVLAENESMQTCGGDHAAAAVALWSSFAGRKPG